MVTEIYIIVMTTKHLQKIPIETIIETEIDIMIIEIGIIKESMIALKRGGYCSRNDSIYQYISDHLISDHIIITSYIYYSELNSVIRIHKIKTIAIIL
ncbi:hypothetical protein DLAC_05320 [Tieghemostelium lacteum]|uniref:Uncharacterized protein n=1 Tax=Tieghemostelium lacteum TaxID=361077 RepID=A0A151ZIU0_TIELA|nr:hypothetical protein DLAC_05320 [Tieghemostelium lacteum]|eukprot:KYQ93911.1 hypothetical protein DLAC_05320 [Tieghemostelium lacteum]